MDEICEDASNVEQEVVVTPEEIYHLSKYLFEASKIMSKIDTEISMQLLNLSSTALDMIRKDRFVKDDLDEIDKICEDILNEGQ